MLHCAFVSFVASNQSGRLIKPSHSEATPMHYRLLYICISWPRMNDTGDHFLWFSHGFTTSKLGALCHDLALPPARSFSAGGLFPRKAGNAAMADGDDSTRKVSSVSVGTSYSL